MNIENGSEALSLSPSQLQERLQIATASSGLSFWEWHPQSNWLSWDASMFRLHGTVPDRTITFEKWKKFVVPEDADLMAAAFLEFVEEKIGGDFEFRIERPDGNIRHLRTVSRVIVDGGTSALRVVGTCLDITTTKRGELERDRIIAELQELLMKVKMLSGLIPICGWCKSVRSDQGYWQTVEQYVRANTAATFSHGICPECADKMKAEIDTFGGDASPQ